MELTVNGTKVPFTKSTVAGYLKAINIPAEDFSSVIVEHNFSILKSELW